MMGSISLGIDFVTGRNRVPRPAAGMTAFLTLLTSTPPGTPRPPSWPSRSSAVDHSLPLVVQVLELLPLGDDERRIGVHDLFCALGVGDAREEQPEIIVATGS